MQFQLKKKLLAGPSMIMHLWIIVIKKLALKFNWKYKIAAKMSRKRTKREVTYSTG